VLVVDDDAASRRMLRTMIEKEDCEIVEAADGEAALKLVAQSPPGMILLDLMMPQMDGFEFAERLHANPQWRSIPVAVMTAKDLTNDDRQRLNGFVSKVIQKGAGTGELLSALRELTAGGAARN
jgi:CheY-like chemotaxis protein